MYTHRPRRGTHPHTPPRTAGTSLSIAAALRHHARRPGRALQTIMNC